MGVTLRHFIALGVIALAVTWILVPLVRKLAIKLGAVDYPNARRVNTVATPRLGGLAMVGGSAVALIVELLGEKYLGWAGFFVREAGTEVNFFGIALGMLVIVAIGAIDDVKSLPAGRKLLGQVVGAAIIAASGVLLSEVMNPFEHGLISFGWFSYPLTIFYLVAFMNVINLIDGLDGLAAGIIAIAASWLFLIALGKGFVETAMFSAIMVGATIGFLRYNFNPASIFMGDCGSLYLGAMLGTVSLLGTMRSPTFVIMAVPLIIAAVPIIDTASAIIRRLKNHQPIQQADKKHLHHRLLNKGLSTRRSVLVVYGWTMLLGFGAFLMSKSYGPMVFVVFGVLAVVSFCISWKIGIIEPVLRHHYHPRKKDDLDLNKGEDQ